MKSIYFYLLGLFFFIALKASAQDYILIPENFYLHKGDELKIHQINASQFIKEGELGFDPSKIDKLLLHNGSKKIDLVPNIKPADSIVLVKAENDGLNTISLARKPVTDDIERDDFVKILEDEGMAQAAEKEKNSSKDTYREKYTWYLKSLVKVDKRSANGFDKPLGHEYEIVLKDNPYKGNYGDDIIAEVTLHGKPIVNATVLFYIKTANGNVFVQKLSADKLGLIYFKLSREGIYMLRSLHIEPSKEKGADYETWMTTYTFAFNSSNEMPNSYKQFGFGNVH